MQPNLDLKFDLVEKPVENSQTTPVEPVVVEDVKKSYLDEMPASISNPGSELHSPAKRLGDCLRAEMKDDPTLYLFSPDETTSNKLDAVYTDQQRAWVMPTRAWDLPESASGHIVELLSENTLFAAMVGHLLGSHEPAFMTSYESFFEIIAAQLIQHLKFLKQVDDADWRGGKNVVFSSAGIRSAAAREAAPLARGDDATKREKMRACSPSSERGSGVFEDGPSGRVGGTETTFFPPVNLLSTSTCWRQDHNGFSHQSPSLISTLLDVPTDKVNCLFPVDDVAATAAFDFMLRTHNVVNLTTFNKTDEPRFIDKNHARFQIENGGASIFGFASDDNPQIIFTAAGDIVTREALAAIKLLKQDLPEARFRFVGIAALTHGAIGTSEKHLPQDIFDAYFEHNLPIIANFHGYPDTLKTILTNYTDPRRLHLHGFSEQGSTTTPLEMLALNHTSRFDLAADAADLLNRLDLAQKYHQILQENHDFALRNGIDHIEL